MNKYYGICYAPHQCKYFCCGECTIDMTNCIVTYDECIKQEKELKPEILSEVKDE